MNRTSLALAWLGMGLLLAVGSMRVAAGPPSVDTKAQADTQLYVRTVPDGAKVAVDGQTIGDSPQLFVVPPGVDRMTVEVELPGHEKQSHVVEIRGGRITRVEFVLTRQPDGVVQPQASADHKAIQEVISRFVDAALRDDKDTLANLVDKDSSSLLNSADDMREAVAAGIQPAEVQVLAVQKDEKDKARALAVTRMTQVTRGTETRSACVLYTLVRQGDRWVIRDIDMEDPEGLAQEIRRFADPPESAAAADSQVADPTRSLGPVIERTLHGPARTRSFVRLVVGKDAMTFEGQKTTWDELPALLEKIPNRAQTVLEIAVASDEVTLKDRTDAVHRGGQLARQLGFEYPSDVGVHPLGSKGTPAQATQATKESSMLRAELERLLTDVLAETSQGDQAGPEGQDLASRVRAAIGELLRADPELLQVTAAQEQDFAAGRFDAVGAARRIDASLEILKDFDVELPKLYRYLFAEFKGDRLRGARLELAARLVQVPLKRTLVVLGHGKDARAARLEFRVAPVREGDAKLKLSPEEIKACMAVLASEGPDAGSRWDDPMVWFPLRGEPSPGLITSEYDGRHYVLLSNRPPEVMSTSPTRGTPWALKHVSVVQDDLGQPAVSLELDANGAERIARLTEDYTGSPLAVVVDNQVLSAPTIRSKLHDKMMITSRFSREEADQLVRGLWTGMVRPAQAPAAP